MEGVREGSERKGVRGGGSERKGVKAGSERWREWGRERE